MPDSARENLLEMRRVYKYFPFRTGFGKTPADLRAVDGVDVTIRRGEILSLVGESGCGKSTLGRVALNLLPVTKGKVLYRGLDIASLPEARMRALRAKMQIIFQDPYSSLNPRMRILDILAEPLVTHRVAKGRAELARTAASLLEEVGMRPEALSRFPHEFSGGQRQRIGVARAIALRPELVVCDEPLSALDVSIRSQVINLLVSLKKSLDLTYLFISHDLSVVRCISDRICVMYLGKLMEIGTSREIFGNPLHPYTKSLISAVPLPDPHRRGRARVLLRGDLPSPFSPPSGCRFRTRCPDARDICAADEPAAPDETRHSAACHFAGRIMPDSAFSPPDSGFSENTVSRFKGEAPVSRRGDES